MKKRTKLTITLIALALFAAGAGIVIGIISTESNIQDTSEQAAVNSDIPCIDIDDNGIREHADVWHTFVQDSQNDKITSIQLNYKYPGQIPHGDGTYGAAPDNITLEFDGENYLCFGKTYKYLLELTGRTPNAAKKTTYAILSNEQYSFKDINNSIYSSNSNDQIPYMLLFTR